MCVYMHKFWDNMTQWTLRNLTKLPDPKGPEREFDWSNQLDNQEQVFANKT